MLDSECVLLAMVVCKVGVHRNKVGFIHSINRSYYNGNDFIEYLVIDNNMNFIGVGPWKDLRCWDIVKYTTLIPVTADNWLESSKRKECPCGIASVDCDYHNGKV